MDISVRANCVRVDGGKMILFLTSLDMCENLQFLALFILINRFAQIGVYLFILESAVMSEGQQLMLKLAGECRAYGRSFMNRTVLADDNDTETYCPAYFDG